MWTHILIYLLPLQIYLPTGMRVEFREGSMDIYPSVKDIDQSEGLCGNYNGDTTDDFQIRDTDKYDDNRYYPNEFSNSWRLVLIFIDFLLCYTANMFNLLDTLSNQWV